MDIFTGVYYIDPENILKIGMTPGDTVVYLELYDSVNNVTYRGQVTLEEVEEG